MAPVTFGLAQPVHFVTLVCFFNLSLVNFDLQNSFLSSIPPVLISGFYYLLPFFYKYQIKGILISHLQPNEIIFVVWIIFLSGGPTIWAASKNILDSLKYMTIAFKKSKINHKYLISLAFPKHIANQLIHPYSNAPHQSFSSIVFIRISCDNQPQLNSLIDQIIINLDTFAQECQIIKVKTFGNIYFGTCGVFQNPNETKLRIHPSERVGRAVQFSKMAQIYIQSLSKQSRYAFQIKCVITSGSVFHRILGTRKYSWNVMGSPVMLAHKILSMSHPHDIIMDKASLILYQDCFSSKSSKSSESSKSQTNIPFFKFSFFEKLSSKPFKNIRLFCDSQSTASNSTKTGDVANELQQPNLLPDISIHSIELSSPKDLNEPLLQDMTSVKSSSSSYHILSTISNGESIPSSNSFSKKSKLSKKSSPYLSVKSPQLSESLFETDGDTLLDPIPTLNNMIHYFRWPLLSLLEELSLIESIDSMSNSFFDMDASMVMMAKDTLERMWYAFNPHFAIFTIFISILQFFLVRVLPRIKYPTHLAVISLFASYLHLFVLYYFAPHPALFFIFTFINQSFLMFYYNSPILAYGLAPLPYLFITILFFYFPDNFTTPVFNLTFVFHFVSSTFYLIGLQIAQVGHFRRIEDSLIKSSAFSLQLVNSMFPKAVVDAIRQGWSRNELRSSKDYISLISLEIDNFYSYSQISSPDNIIKHFSSILSLIDSASNEFEVEKVKAIGNTWIGVSGLFPNPGTFINQATKVDQVKKLLQFFESCTEHLREYSESNLYNFTIKAVIHAGPVYSGVLGKERISFDIWGTTVDELEQFMPVCESNRVFLHPSLIDIIPPSVLHNKLVQISAETLSKVE